MINPWVLLGALIGLIVYSGGLAYYAHSEGVASEKSLWDLDNAKKAKEEQDKKDAAQANSDKLAREYEASKQDLSKIKKELEHAKAINVNLRNCVTDDGFLRIYEATLSNIQLPATTR